MYSGHGKGIYILDVDCATVWHGIEHLVIWITILCDMEYETKLHGLEYHVT